MCNDCTRRTEETLSRRSNEQLEAAQACKLQTAAHEFDLKEWFGLLVEPIPVYDATKNPWQLCRGKHLKKLGYILRSKYISELKHGLQSPAHASSDSTDYFATKTSARNLSKIIRTHWKMLKIDSGAFRGESNPHQKSYLQQTERITKRYGGVLTECLRRQQQLMIRTAVQPLRALTCCGSLRRPAV